MIFAGHRLSRDIDGVIDDPQSPALLAPATTDVYETIRRVVTHELSDFSAVAACECIVVMDLQPLIRSTPVLREIQFQQCSFYSRRLLEAAAVNVVSAWK
jgi:hypothetical protein